MVGMGLAMMFSLQYGVEGATWGGSAVCGVVVVTFCMWIIFDIQAMQIDLTADEYVERRRERERWEREREEMRERRRERERDCVLCGVCSCALCRVLVCCALCVVHCVLSGAPVLLNTLSPTPFVLSPPASPPPPLPQVCDGSGGYLPRRHARIPLALCMHGRLFWRR